MGPRSQTLSLTESGYAEQLFQFLRATAQEEGLFGESQQLGPGPGVQEEVGCWLLPLSGQ